ncbi:hypothetical protein [Bacillus sp. OTU530]|uniref:hypothetical protein n=1 Tax=Bacillus sp. OTU530 TaxID=3043862 RepID=UPI00313E6314
MNLFLIRYSNDKYVVEADTAQEAISAWIDTKNKEEADVYESKRKFKPNNFSVERIGTYHGVIKASE